MSVKMIASINILFYSQRDGKMVFYKVYIVPQRPRTNSLDICLSMNYKFHINENKGESINIGCDGFFLLNLLYKMWNVLGKAWPHHGNFNKSRVRSAYSRHYCCPS